MKPSDAHKPQQTPQQGNETKPAYQGYNSYKGVKKSQSGSTSNSGGRKRY